jgi:hypothetical protein
MHCNYLSTRYLLMSIFVSLGICLLAQTTDTLQQIQPEPGNPTIKIGLRAFETYVAALEGYINK